VAQTLSGNEFFLKTGCALEVREYNSRCSVRCPQRIFGIAGTGTLRRGQRSLQAMESPMEVPPHVRESDDVASADVALLFASAFDAVRQ